MLKKVALIGLGAVLVGGLLFGGRLVPYAHTAFNKARQAAQQSVPLSFQIDAAKEQLEKINPEIKNMIWQIAKEKAEIKRLERELDSQTTSLGKKQDEILALRQHLTSGDEVYVATNGKAYSNSRVEEDLKHRFSVFKTAKQTVDKTEQILDMRHKALDAAMAKLEQAQSLQRELEVQVENLNARERMVDVAKTASSINLDDSQLARTQKMIDEISAKIDAEEEMLALAPQYLGEIPVSADSEWVGKDIGSEIDSYFGNGDETSDLVVSN
ncbi:MAG: hypothetical protein R3C03_14610 [Pirellulaceae bacterium]